jgi:hypothetical protein
VEAPGIETRFDATLPQDSRAQSSSDDADTARKCATLGEWAGRLEAPPTALDHADREGARELLTATLHAALDAAHDLADVELARGVHALLRAAEARHRPAPPPRVVQVSIDLRGQRDGEAQEQGDQS